jgi:hypothetical protein
VGCQKKSYATHALGIPRAIRTLYYNGDSVGARDIGDLALQESMSYLITPFDVSSKALGGRVHCRFVHLLSGIATRHSDTIDCVFLQDGKKLLVAISCAALTEIREREHQRLSDQQLAEVAALHLRRTLEQGYDPSSSELFLGGEQLRQLAGELGYL